MEGPSLTGRAMPEACQLAGDESSIKTSLLLVARPDAGRPGQNLPGINHAATPDAGKSRARPEVTATMKVSGAGVPTSASGAIGPRPARAAAGGFQPAPVSAAAEPQGAMGASTVNAVNSLEALIALQEVGGP